MDFINHRIIFWYFGCLFRNRGNAQKIKSHSGEKNNSHYTFGGCFQNDIEINRVSLVDGNEVFQKIAKRLNS